MKPLVNNMSHNVGLPQELHSMSISLLVNSIDGNTYMYTYIFVLFLLNLLSLILNVNISVMKTTLLQPPFKHLYFNN